MRRSTISLLVCLLLPHAVLAQEDTAAKPDDASLVQEAEEGVERAADEDEPAFASGDSVVAPEGEPLPANSAPAPASWRPPVPDESKKDWIRLSTGEWLRGNIENIEDGTLYFDSAELDDLEIDWPVISELRSSSVNSYRFEGRVVVTGTAGMVDGVMRVETAEGIREFEQAKLVGFIEGDLTEWNFWSGDLSFSLAALSGNTNQTDLQGRFYIKRETPLTRTYLRYTGVYATNDGTADPTVAPLGETANNHRIRSAFDVYFTRRLFLSMPFVEFYNDSFQNIDARITPGVAVGYDVLTYSKIMWEVSGGLAYQYTNFNAADPQISNDAAIVLGTVLETDPLKNLEWDTIFSAQLNVTNFDNTNTHFETILSLDIWGPLDLDLGFYWDYIVKPAATPTANPTATVPPTTTFRPDSHDIRLTIGLAYDW